MTRGDTARRQPTDSEPSDRGRLERLRDRLSVPFSLRTFLLAVALAVVGGVLVGLVPFVPATVATAAGVLVAGFLLGVGRATRSYLEVAAAGTATAAVGVVPRFLLLSFLGDIGVSVTLVGTGSGLLAGVLGHYLGRDLRAGLTRDL